MSLVLTFPEARFERSYNEYINELGSEVRHPFPLDFDHHDFPALLARIERCRQGIGLAPEFVASTTFWLVDGNDLVGVSNLRHCLNEWLQDYGGHIGLGVRPSRRNQGLGSHLLRLTIQQARSRGIDTVHVHCYRSNPASAKVIMRNGGALASEGRHGQASEIIQRYCIAAA